jgi:peptidoglycan/LPS O-acetylase OafA/YrhL
VVTLVLLLLLLPSNLIGLPNFAIHLTMTTVVGSLVIREDSPLMPILSYPPIARVGMVSYGIYLLHLIALDMSRRLAGMFEATEGSLLHHAVYVALSLILAELSFRYFERVFLDMRGSFARVS